MGEVGRSVIESFYAAAERASRIVSYQTESVSGWGGRLVLF
jgi:hypothetical protein